jgi:hypothetical protein
MPLQATQLRKQIHTFVTPVRTRLCNNRLPFIENDYSHSSHVYGLGPVCMYMVLQGSLRGK